MLKSLFTLIITLVFLGGSTELPFKPTLAKETTFEASACFAEIYLSREEVAFSDSVESGWEKLLLPPSFCVNDLRNDVVAMRAANPIEFERFTRDPRNFGWVKQWKAVHHLPEIRANVGALDAINLHRSGQAVPLPDTYLNSDYIISHLSKFDAGGSYIVPTEALDTYGRNLVGRPDGQFIAPASEIDDLLSLANGDISVIEEALGIPSGLWQGKQLSRIDIPNTFSLNRRLPSGNEGGANELWIPGGVTSGGKSEAVIDQIPLGSYEETSIN